VALPVCELGVPSNLGYTMRLLCKTVIEDPRRAPEAMSGACASMLVMPSSSCTVADTKRSKLSVPRGKASFAAVAVAAAALAKPGACWATSQSAIWPTVG